MNKGLEIFGGGIVFEGMAAVSTAAEVEDGGGGVWGEDGFALTKGLVERVYFARAQGGNAAWWKRRLAESVEGTGVLGIAVLLTWGTADVLAEVHSVIGRRVEELRSGDWERLWNLNASMGRATAGKASELTESWFGGLDSPSPRVMSCLVGRIADREARRRVARRHFRGNDSWDPFSLWATAQCEYADANWDGIDWEFVVQLSKHARQRGMRIMFPVHRSEGSVVPEKIATKVLEECSVHCEQLVWMCEDAYSRILAKQGRRVSVVAEEDEWFAAEWV